MTLTSLALLSQESSDLSLCGFFTNIVPPMPEEGVQWMRCDECEKWRKLKPEVSRGELEGGWKCADGATQLLDATR
jgi:hypothetical protein